MDGKAVSAKIKEELKGKIARLEEKPGLVVIQVGENPASTIYVNAKAKLAREIGYNFEHVSFPEKVTEAELIAKIYDINNNPQINGVIVQLPIPAHLNANRIINQIDPTKDIDGLTEINAGKLLTGEADLVSCTPKGIMTLLREYNVVLDGKHVVIVGRSNLVGKPLISLCLNANATVTVCHSHTVNLVEYTKLADVLIVAIGKPKYITADYIKAGAVVVDVGINRVNGKVVGDVDYENVRDKASLITPVPGGVGPMTTISLMENVYTSYVKTKKL